MITLPNDAELPNNPRIGWRTILADGTLAASASADGFPVSELQNPATYLEWRGASAAQHTITLELPSPQTADYVGIARHNFGSAGIAYTLETSDDDVAYSPVATDTPDDDKVIIHEFASASAQYWRLTLAAGSAAPRIAVLYIGEMLTVERRIYVGHTPIPFGRRRRISTGRSENGQFLGRVRQSTLLATRVSLGNLDPDWYRQNLDPFADASDETPFFWAWRPMAYPDECGYVWLTEEPNPSNQRANGMMQVELSMQGIP